MIIYGCSGLRFGHAVLHSTRSSLGNCASLISFFLTFNILFVIESNFFFFLFRSLPWQILSATWTSPSLTWNWTVFWTSPTFPNSETQCRWSIRPKSAEGIQRMSVRARCYDAAEIPPSTHLHSSPLQSRMVTKKRENLTKTTGGISNTIRGRYAEHFLFSISFFFSFCLIWFTCNIAFKVTRDSVNGLLGGTSVSFCCGCSSPVLHVCPANSSSSSLLPSLLSCHLHSSGVDKKKKKTHP